MNKPVRIQLSRKKGFNLQKVSFDVNGLTAVNVSRPSLWGNPFIIGKHGTREQCVHLFRCLCAGYMTVSLSPDCAKEQQRFSEYALKHIKDIRGKNLGCWCGPAEKCHADVLLEIANT